MKKNRWLLVFLVCFLPACTGPKEMALKEEPPTANENPFYEITEQTPEEPDAPDNNQQITNYLNTLNIAPCGIFENPLETKWEEGYSYTNQATGQTYTIESYTRIKVADFAFEEGVVGAQSIDLNNDGSNELLLFYFEPYTSDFDVQKTRLTASVLTEIDGQFQESGRCTLAETIYGSETAGFLEVFIKETGSEILIGCNNNLNGGGWFADGIDQQLKVFAYRQGALEALLHLGLYGSSFDEEIFISHQQEYEKASFTSPYFSDWAYTDRLISNTETNTTLLLSVDVFFPYDTMDYEVFGKDSAALETGTGNMLPVQIAVNDYTALAEYMALEKRNGFIIPIE